MNAVLFSIHSDEAAVLTVMLQQAGASVRVVRDLGQVIHSWEGQPADIVVLAWSHEEPVLSDSLHQMRTLTAAPLVVIVDALVEADQVALYEAGADLVIPRPYGVRLLLAMIRALLRRSSGVPYFSLPTLHQGGVALDPAARTVQVGEAQPVRLTQLEFRLLYTLMTHSGQIIPSERIVDLVWGYSGEGSRELVRGLVQRLRAKVEPNPHIPKYILTEPGVGYYFDRYSEPE